MQTASDIIKALGGSTVVARHTGWALTTVDSWKTSNFVPEWRRPTLLKLAKKLSVPLADDDFPPVSARRSRAQVAA